MPQLQNMRNHAGSFFFCEKRVLCFRDLGGVREPVQSAEIPDQSAEKHVRPGPVRSDFLPLSFFFC